MSDRLVVNQHYLNHVVAAAETTGVEATEDIVSGSGIKLVAKGARIDARVQERLLQHKLRKPLESSIRVIDGALSRPIDQIATALLDKHALMAGICSRATARRVAAALRDLRLSTPVESLVDIYAAQAPNKIEHAVGVSLLAAVMVEDLLGGSERAAHVLMVAGLLHDVGEVYIDPVYLQAGTRLTPAQWKHVAAHPVVASHVLRDMAGVGPQVAEAVLHHHERLDGFGYPQGLQGAGLPVTSQALAMAEMLMGLIESGRSPGERAAIAVKLIPGEFNRRLVDRVASAARFAAASDSAEQALTPPATIEDLVDKVTELGVTLQALHQLRDGAADHHSTGGAELKELMTHVLERCDRIRLSFSSVGLDSHEPEVLRDQLSAMGPQVHGEVAIVLREVEWRLREVKREASLRAERLPPAAAATVLQFLALIRPPTQEASTDEAR